MLEWLHMNFRKHYKTNFYPCIEDVLKKLAQSYKVALISNTMSDQPKLLLQEAGYDQYFDLIITSQELGIRKPNPKIFKTVLGELGVKPDETVHVGDSVEADMYGARNSGITGIWIKTPEQAPWNGYAINSICDLPGFLEKISD
jgi:putative hydrolase of the HAD superfamily